MRSIGDTGISSSSASHRNHCWRHRYRVAAVEGELAQLCGYTAANVSRHLSLMTQQGFVTRESRGTSVYYRIADPSVYALCDLVCDSIARQYERALKNQQAIFTRGDGAA